MRMARTSRSSCGLAACLSLPTGTTLLSVLQYDDFVSEIAMAYGDVFVHKEVSAFALADFATRCGIGCKLVRREAQRLARLAIAAAAAQALSADYLADERPCRQPCCFVRQQAQRLSKLFVDAASIKAGYL